MIDQKDKEIFENLFVLEMANNHWGKLDRGLKIIRDHGAIVRHNGVRAAIKLQFRDVEDFIHPEFKGNLDFRYIKKTEDTKVSSEDFSRMVDEIRNVGAIPMATPFDEASVDLCVYFDMPIIKVASSDINAWPLIEKIASTRRPVIISTGGASEKNMDDVVYFFEKRDIPLAINHCVALYPSEDSELELDQIDFIRNRYPKHVIGLSTHEYHDWYSSILISYAKGARTWERHIDIDHEGVPVSSYCSLPQHCDTWFKGFHKAQEMCGGQSQQRRVISRKEIEYLDALVRGAYAKTDREPGYVITKEGFLRDFYMAVPLLKGQLSVREIMNGERLTTPIKANDALTIDHIDGPYAENPELRKLILNRGL
jgi:N-acetylneuraminate synthase